MSNFDLFLVFLGDSLFGLPLRLPSQQLLLTKTQLPLQSGKQIVLVYQKFEDHGAGDAVFVFLRGATDQHFPNFAGVVPEHLDR